jgi:hypothetical protein
LNTCFKHTYFEIVFGVNVAAFREGTGEMGFPECREIVLVWVHGVELPTTRFSGSAAEGNRSEAAKARIELL